jgi:hypothetical protein
MVFTIATVLYIIAAILAFLAAFPIPTGSVNLLALAVAFLALGHVFG